MICQKEPSKGKPSRRRRWSLNADVVDACMKLHGMDMSEFLDLTMKEGIRRCKSGPDVTTVNRAFHKGYATPWVYSLILHVLQEKYLEAYATGKLTRDTAPMITDLNNWPSRKMRDEYYRGFRWHQPRGRSPQRGQSTGSNPARTAAGKEKKPQG